MFFQSYSITRHRKNEGIDNMTKSNIDLVIDILRIPAPCLHA